MFWIIGGPVVAGVVGLQFTFLWMLADHFEHGQDFIVIATVLSAWVLVTLTLKCAHHRPGAP